MNNTYETEARERWGNTDAYREHLQKTKNYSNKKWASVTDGIDEIFARFAECKASGASADSEMAETHVAELQTFITTNFYNCTKEILYSLGQMYVCDERFKKNIDKHGDGTTEFVCAAIAVFTR